MKNIFAALGFVLALGTNLSVTRAQDVATTPLASLAPMRQWGTGFVVDHRGHVLTADHVTRDCRQVTLYRNGVRAAASVRARDAANDLSLLTTVAELGTPAIFAADSGAARGALVLIASYPDAAGLVAAGSGGGLMFNGMIMSGAESMASPRRFFIVTDVRPGSSGSPVADSRGFVAGVLTAKMTWRGGSAPAGRPTEVRVATTSAVAKDLLRRHDVEFLEEGMSAGRRAARTRDLLQYSELRVECRGD